MKVLPARIGTVVLSLATIVVVAGVGVAVLFNPLWVSFEQGRADAAAWTGFTPAELRTVTDSILSELYLGPGDFAVSVGGVAVLDARERAHMRDVRAVFVEFGAAVIGSLAVLVVGRVATRGGASYWRAVRAGASVLVIAVIALGALAVVAFDALFELFHRLFFAGGSYTFDPRTERLVQLFPDRFWFETSIALGAVLLGLGLLGRWFAGRRVAASGPGGTAVLRARSDDRPVAVG